MSVYKNMIILCIHRIYRWFKFMDREIDRLLYGYIYTYITKKNFGLIPVYFLYTVFLATYRAVISKVTCLLNYIIEKNRGGGGLGDSRCWSYTVGILA